MQIHISPNDGVAIYLQIVNQIKYLVASGRLNAGEELPAIRVLAEYGSADQKARYLKRLLAGEGVISVGMTEPEAGSAVTDLKTTATPDGAGFRINIPNLGPLRLDYGIPLTADRNQNKSGRFNFDVGFTRDF